MKPADLSYWLPLYRPLRVQIYFVHLLLFMISLPFDRMYSHLVLISFCLQLALGTRSFRLPEALPWKKWLLPAAVFFCTGFSLLYSPARSEGAKEWLLQVPLLLMPVLMYLVSPELKRYRNSFLTAFSLISVGCVVYLFANAFWTIRHFGLPVKALFTYAFTNHNFSEPLKMHATYLSMQWMLALVFLLQQGWKRDKSVLRTCYFIAAGVLVAGLLQLCSKAVGAVLICIVVCAWPLVLRNAKSRKLALFTSLALVCLIFGLVGRSPAFRERYLSALHDDFVHPEAGELAEPRVARWISAIEIAQSSMLFGKGAGTEKALLHEVFYRKKYYNSFLNHLNAHSEYLSLLLKNGLTGLCLYLVALAYGFRYAVKSRDALFFTFMLLIALVSFGENILDLDKGVYFYALFFAFFLFFPESRPAAQPGPRFSRNYRKKTVSIPLTVTVSIAGNNS